MLGSQFQAEFVSIGMKYLKFFSKSEEESSLNQNASVQNTFILNAAAPPKDNNDPLDTAQNEDDKLFELEEINGNQDHKDDQNEEKIDAVTNTNSELTTTTTTTTTTSEE